MAVVMHMQWDGVTPEQYNQARAEVAWETDVPHGAILHIPCFTDTGLRVTDVWETPADFNAFVEHRLTPAITKIGISGEPEVDIYPLHEHVFAPDIDKVTTHLAAS